MDALREMLTSDPYCGFRLSPSAKRVVTFLRDKPESKLRLPLELDGARSVAQQGQGGLHGVPAHPKGAAFMSLIEKTFGKAVTTRTWDTVAKVVRAKRRSAGRRS